MKSVQELKDQAMKWPDPWGLTARELIRDAHWDLMMCQRRHLKLVVEDLRTALLSLKSEMIMTEEEEMANAKN